MLQRLCSLLLTASCALGAIALECPCVEAEDSVADQTEAWLDGTWVLRTEGATGVVSVLIDLEQTRYVAKSRYHQMAHSVVTPDGSVEMPETDIIESEESGTILSVVELAEGLWTLTIEVDELSRDVMLRRDGDHLVIGSNKLSRKR